jgi:hypothetical protein
MSQIPSGILIDAWTKDVEKREELLKIYRYTVK